MSPRDVADNKVTADTERASSAYVPPLQRTEGQPPPIAAHGGLSYMSFDRDGDAGTAAAIQDALAEIAEGESRVIDMIAKAPPGPIKTKWGALTTDEQDLARRLFLGLIRPGEGREDTRARMAMPDDAKLRAVAARFADLKARWLVTGWETVPPEPSVLLSSVAASAIPS